MAGRSIFVLKAFSLLLNEAEMAAAGVSQNILRFAMGRHDDVPDVIANHPQVKTHTGSDADLAGAMTAPAASTVPTVPLADLEAAQGEVANLRAQVDELNGRLAVQGSMMAGLQAQVRQAAESRAQSESDMAEAASRIRELAVRLNVPPESVLPASMTAPASEAPQASGEAPDPAAEPPAPAQDGQAADGQNAGNPEGQTASDPAADAVAITVQHKGAGRYAVFRGDTQVTEPTTREEADAQAAQLAGQAAPAAAETPPAA